MLSGNAVVFSVLIYSLKPRALDICTFICCIGTALAQLYLAFTEEDSPVRFRIIFSVLSTYIGVCYRQFHVVYSFWQHFVPLSLQ
jgi:hypothetical protein